MNKPFFYNDQTSGCPEAKICPVAKLSFCERGRAGLYQDCPDFHGKFAECLEGELTSSAPLTATIEEMIR